MRLFQFILVASILGAVPCFGQNKQGTGVESNHSVYVSVGAFNYNIQAGYTYEWALSRKWTVLGSVGLKGEYSWGMGSFSGNSSTFLLFPSISVEPRFYYNLGKRMESGKSTLFNSGGYLGSTFSCFSPSIYGTGRSERNFFHGGVGPHWGWRKVFDSRIFVDVHAGALMLFTNKEVVWGPDLNVKFGYVF